MLRRTGTGRVRRRDDIARPRGTTVSIGAHVDPETFGRFSETIARDFGTARFLAIQTVVVAAWIVLNTPGSSATGTRTRSSCSTCCSPRRPPMPPRSSSWPRTARTNGTD